MDKQVSAKEFILALGKPYFHHIKNQFYKINPCQLDNEETRNVIYIIGMESQKYAMALGTFKNRMPDEEGEFLLSQLITRMELAYTFREKRFKEISDIVDRIYTTYSQLKEYFTKH